MDELKKFAVDNLFSWSLKSRTGITQLISHVLGSRASEKVIVTTEQVQLGIRVKVQL